MASVAYATCVATLHALHSLHAPPTLRSLRALPTLHVPAAGLVVDG